jgi:hypothetical protein
VKKFNLKEERGRKEGKETRILKGYRYERDK